MMGSIIGIVAVAAVIYGALFIGYKILNSLWNFGGTTQNIPKPAQEKSGCDHIEGDSGNCVLCGEALHNQPSSR